MEVEVGDIFKSFLFNYKVIQIINERVDCDVYFDDRKVAKSLEHKNTLLGMQKLSSLEKELM